MLKLEALEAFLIAQGITTPIVFHRPPSLTPANVIVLSEIRGGETELEDAIDFPGVQTLVRHTDPQVARDLINQLDSIYLNHSLWPFDLGGKRVLSMGRMGGGPAYLDTDSQDRTLYTVSNWFQMER